MCPGHASVVHDGGFLGVFCGIGAGSDWRCLHGRAASWVERQSSTVPGRDRRLRAGAVGPDRANRQIRGGRHRAGFPPRLAPARFAVPYGVQSGDVTQDRPATGRPLTALGRMIVEYATTDQLTDAKRVVGDAAIYESCWTAKTMLTDLTGPAQDLFYRVTFQDLTDLVTFSEPAIGRLKTVPTDRRDVSFVWSGHAVGQGWGINPELGPRMRLDDVMRKANPDFFVHSGDMIYADGPLLVEEKLPERLHLAEHRHRGQVEGRRDDRGVPWQLRLQPDGRQCSGLQRRGGPVRPVG